MRFSPPLTSAILLRRYKRFLADVRLADGQQMTVHCPNTGAMLGCDQPGSQVLLSHSQNPARKYAYTWELVRPPGGPWVGIHSAKANHLVQEAIDAQRIESLAGYSELRREVPYPGGRFDFELSAAGRRACLIEVKSVTAAADAGVALFPDARSTRGARHALDLAEQVNNGYRCCLLFCVQREDVEVVRPADAIDPDYGVALRAAAQAGVEVLAAGCAVGPAEISIRRPLPVDLT